MNPGKSTCVEDEAAGMRTSPDRNDDSMWLIDFLGASTIPSGVVVDNRTPGCVQRDQYLWNPNATVTVGMI